MQNDDGLTMPTECLVHWLSDIEAAQDREKHRKRRALIIRMKMRARRQWMRHDITIDDVKKFFSASSLVCRTSRLSALFQSAEKRDEEISVAYEMLHSPQPQDRLKILEKLNENLYGRLFESVLMNEIIKNPTRKMRKTVKSIGTFFYDYLKNLTLEEKHEIILLVKKEFSDRWEKATLFDETLKNFADTERNDPQTADKDFISCLFSKMNISSDVGLLPYIHIVMSFMHTLADYAPWKKNILKYYEIILAIRSRHPQIKEKTATEYFGITLNHQPSMHRDLTRTARAIDFLGGLDVAGVKPPAENALLHGHPFVCGISTHTMSLLHAVAYAKARFPKASNIDLKYVILAYIAHLVDIGAHSIQEALWIAYELDKPLHLGLEHLWNDAQRKMPFRRTIIADYVDFTESDDESVVNEAKAKLITYAFESNFAADFEKFFHAFDDDKETNHCIKKALEQAWEATVHLFREQHPIVEAARMSDRQTILPEASA